MITPAQENERMLANILGISENEAAERLDRKVVITYGDGPAQQVAQEIKEQLERTIHIVEDGDADLEIIVDASPRLEAGKQLFVSLEANQASISTAPPAKAANTVAVHGLKRVITACYAAAIAINKVTGLERVGTDPFTIEFAAAGINDLVLDRAITLNGAVLIGAGAVGNGFLRAARHLSLKGSLNIVDPKIVGGGNPNRCLYFANDDVGQPKADTLCRKAAPDFPNLSLWPSNEEFSQFVKSVDRVHRIIVAADSRRVRRSFQKEMPMEVIDASTTGVDEVIVHSHRQPTSGACLACVYKHIPDELAREREIAGGLGIPVEAIAAGFIDQQAALAIKEKHPTLHEDELINKSFDSMFKMLCGEGKLLSPAGQQVLAPFAFVSNLAGALLALELALFEAGDLSTNFFIASPWAPPNKRMRIFKAKDLNCEFCANPNSLDVLRSVWPEYFAA